MENILIFNSEENYSDSLCIKINDLSPLNFNKVTIWKNINNFSEVTLYTDDIITIDKMEKLIKTSCNEDMFVTFYPDLEMDCETYFSFELLKGSLFENKNIFPLTKIFKLYCKPNFTLK